MGSRDEFLNEYVSDRLHEIISYLDFLSEKKEHVLVAIDGRCASGKTTFAGLLSNKLDCPVVHMDDFFLQREQRTEERYREPGGNVDYERFYSEVLLPLSQGHKAEYRRFDCTSMELAETVRILPSKIAVIEGSYSLREEFRKYYSLKIFMDISPQDQKERIVKRNGREKAEIFYNRWIPLEEAYIKALEPDKCADYYLNESMAETEP